MNFTHRKFPVQNRSATVSRSDCILDRISGTGQSACGQEPSLEPLPLMSAFHPLLPLATDHLERDGFACVCWSNLTTARKASHGIR